MIPLDREVEHIWQSKWSIPKVLFLITRYGTFLDIPMRAASESESIFAHRWNGEDAEWHSAVCSIRRSVRHDEF